jgi:hypothetical protein
MKNIITVSAMISINIIILFFEEVYVTDCLSGTNLNSLLSKLYNKANCFYAAIVEDYDSAGLQPAAQMSRQVLIPALASSSDQVHFQILS